MIRDAIEVIGCTAVIIALVVGCAYAFVSCDQRSMMLNCGGRRVVAVGGCDKYGQCGVVLDDGRKIRLDHPVVGEKCP